MELKCSYCEPAYIVKNGTTRHDKQNHKCKNCNRQFVINLNNQLISATKIKLIDKFLLERMYLRAINRVANISLAWVQCYDSNVL
ncbi:transposase-like zinc-binding domain-containing protein [Neosynechococcus sphagnicola]|uniref:IS1/IS1595 family N-terminal zinc-binding domain-containing protein n=1 Tax=Neosynechococcus sphagnicola TaxID=1501145 RepID=UPI0009079F38